MEVRQIREEGEREKVSKALNERIEIHDESRKATQEKLHNFCEELREQIDELEERVNSDLEEKFTAEDNRLQTALSELRSSDVSKKIRKAKTELLVEQTYNVVERDSDENESDQKSRISSLYELKTERKVVSLKLIEFEGRKPANLVPSFTEKGELSLSFSFFSEDEVEVLKDVDSPFEAEVKVWEKGQEEEGTSKTLTKELILGSDDPICFRGTFMANTSYCLKVRIAHKEVSTQWSDETEFTPPEFKGLCIWKECPDNVDEKRRYSVDEKNPRIATKIEYGWSTIIGNTPLPLNKVTSWRIRILKSKWNNGDCINIGVAPFDINQNENDKRGWYFNCYESILYSGPPYNYWDKEYGPKKGDGKYVHTGDSVGVVMDATKGELSFALNGVNLGVAYEGISLDKPLVPCVLLCAEGDSVEFDTSEVKKTVVDSSIRVPSNITAKSTTWNSITLTWNAVKGVSSYQIEVDGSKSLSRSSTNAFTKRGLLPETEHTFRVRVMRGNSVSRWSYLVKGRTEKAPFEIEDGKTLFVGELPDIITNENFDQIFEGFPFKEAAVLENEEGKYGIATFSSEEEAQEALDSLCGAIVEGKEIVVKFLSKRKVHQPVPVPQVQERLSEEEEKQNIGERIFNVAMTAYGNEDLSGRLTGMILDSVQVPELHALMGNEENLKAKIGEAKAFLDDYAREHPEQQ